MYYKSMYHARFVVACLSGQWYSYNMINATLTIDETIAAILPQLDEHVRYFTPGLVESLREQLLTAVITTRTFIPAGIVVDCDRIRVFAGPIGFDVCVPSERDPLVNFVL